MKIEYYKFYHDVSFALQKLQNLGNKIVNCDEK